MWRRDNGLELTVLAPKEALDTIRAGHQPPAFVALEVLALGTLQRLSFVELVAGGSVELPGAKLEAVALHHYSGIAPNQRYLDTLGYRLAVVGGPTVAYLSDHEPTVATRAMEDAVVASSQLVIVDANHSDVAQHTFGHGSIEYAADLARRHPDTRVIAGHHGPMQSDQADRRRVPPSRRRQRESLDRGRGRRRGVGSASRPLSSRLEAMPLTLAESTSVPRDRSSARATAAPAVARRSSPLAAVPP